MGSMSSSSAVRAYDCYKHIVPIIDGAFVAHLTMLGLCQHVQIRHNDVPCRVVQELTVLGLGSDCIDPRNHLYRRLYDPR